jgi:hypothetical protein
MGFLWYINLFSCRKIVVVGLISEKINTSYTILRRWNSSISQSTIHPSVTWNHSIS